jgi:hypothetical protein
MLVVATCVRDPWPDGSECCAGAVVGVDPPRPAGGRDGWQLATCSFFSFFCLINIELRALFRCVQN